MDKYLHFTSADFAQEPSFIQWVKKQPSPEDWDAFILQNPSKSKDISEAISLVNSMKFDNDNSTQFVENKIWEKINQQINVPVTKPKTSRFSILSIAAIGVLLLTAGLFFFNQSSDQVFQTHYGETQVIDLPDGSVVYLNADSHLQFNDQNWKEKRQLNLEGEAFFEVIKGSDFIVNTALGDVQVLGTSFNVFVRDTQFKTWCKTGQVKVVSKQSQEIINPDESVELKSNILIKEKTTKVNQDRASWRTGTFVYDNQDLQMVIGDLERQFNIKINCPISLQKMKYKGSFSVSNLENALSEVFWPLKLTFEVQGQTVNITK